MQQQSSCSATFADRSIAIGFGTPTANKQLAGVLNHDDLTAGNTVCRACRRMGRHFGDAYLLVTQQARKLHLACSIASKPSNARTWSSNQRLVQQGPPFSRRRSPNRPSPPISSIISLQTQLGV